MFHQVRGPHDFFSRAFPKPQVRLQGGCGGGRRRGHQPKRIALTKKKKKVKKDVRTLRACAKLDQDSCKTVTSFCLRSFEGEFCVTNQAEIPLGETKFSWETRRKTTILKIQSSNSCGSDRSSLRKREERCCSVRSMFLSFHFLFCSSFLRYLRCQCRKRKKNHIK